MGHTPSSTDLRKPNTKDTKDVLLLRVCWTRTTDSGDPYLRQSVFQVQMQFVKEWPAGSTHPVGDLCSDRTLCSVHLYLIFILLCGIISLSPPADASEY